MSLWDSIGKGLAGQLAGGGQQNNLLAAAAQLIGSSNIGGLGGLTQLFNKHGQGDTVASWVSTGDNKPISPDALRGVLGQERIQEVATTAGVSEQEATQGLSSLLPQLVDKLTPDGKLPPDESANSALSQLATQFLGRH